MSESHSSVSDSLRRQLADGSCITPIVDCIRKMRLEGLPDNEIAGLLRHAADELDGAPNDEQVERRSAAQALSEDEARRIAANIAKLPELLRNAEISRKHGNTLIRTLRRTYGPGFARGCDDNDKLSDVVHKLDEPSLRLLIRDHDAGYLEQICQAA